METPTKTPKPPPPPPLPMPGGLATAIAREELMQLPLWRYSGPVRLVNSPASLAQAQAALESATILGLDTETQPTFRKGQVHLPCLVQVAAAEAVYLFQLRQVNCADYLAGLLGRADVIKAGIGLDHDFAKLKQVFPFAPRGIVDLAVIAKRYGVGQPGLRTLAALFFGLRLPKGQQTSNWSRPVLSEQQISYAAADAWICRELHLRFEQLGLR
jgi:ribonuclease D